MTRKLHGVERLHACAGILRLTEKLDMSTLELQDHTELAIIICKKRYSLILCSAIENQPLHC